MIVVRIDSDIGVPVSSNNQTRLWSKEVTVRTTDTVDTPIVIGWFGINEVLHRTTIRHTGTSAAMTGDLTLAISMNSPTTPLVKEILPGDAFFNGATPLSFATARDDEENVQLSPAREVFPLADLAEGFGSTLLGGYRYAVVFIPRALPVGPFSFYIKGEVRTGARVAV